MTRLLRAGLLSLLLLALVGAMCPVPARASVESQPAAIQVYATAYTCEAHPDNPMHPCGIPRWGGDAMDGATAMACPVAWRGKSYQVDTFGVRLCDDTPRDDYINGLPHIDIRVATYDLAMWWGVRVIEVIPVEASLWTWEPVPAATPTPTPAPAVAVERWEVYYRWRKHLIEIEMIPPPSVPVWVARMIDVR